MWFQIVSYSVLLVILAFDVFLAYRSPHAPSNKESALWITFYVSLSLVFAGCIFLVSGAEPSINYITGWLTEYSLSMDNLFVFLIVIASFKVPREHQPSVIMVGILLSLVFRGAFIALGSKLVESFSWIFYIFGAFLVYTAIKQALPEKHEEEGEGGFTKFLRKVLPLTDQYDGSKMRTTIDGKKLFTPIFLVIASLGGVNVVFALDSIPAIFGITTDPFIVFTTNIFALMGLRQLYFLLGHLVEKLLYLKYGIAVILGFIGAKLVLHALHTNTLPFINGGGHLGVWVPDTVITLIVIVGAIVVSVVASLLKSNSDEKKGITTEPATLDDMSPLI